MSRAGGLRRALALALGLAVTGLSLVGTASAIPLRGGPTIRDATYDTGNAAGLADDVLYVVIDGANISGLAAADFATTGSIDLTGAVFAVVSTRATAALVTFTGPTVAMAAGDQVVFSDLGVVAGAIAAPFFPGTSPNTDLTPHAIHTGPIIFTAEHDTGASLDDPTDDSVVVRFNQLINASDGAVAYEYDDFVAPFFGDAADLVDANIVQVSDAAPFTIVQIPLDDIVAPTSGKLTALGSHIKLTGPNPSDGIQDETGASTVTSQVPTSIAQSPIAADGPYLIDAAYNNQATDGGANVGDDVLTLSFDRDIFKSGEDDLLAEEGIKPTDLTFTVAGAFGAASTFSVDRNMVTINMGAGATLPGAASTISPAVVNLITDIYGHQGGQSSPVLITAGAGEGGPAIIRVEQIGSQLFVLFNEDIGGLATTDFALNGQAGGTQITAISSTAGPLAVLNTSNAWNDGDYLALSAAGVVSGLSSGNLNLTANRHPVAKGDGPAAPPIQLISDVAVTFEDDATGIANISWRETAGTDTSDYYLIFTRIGAAIDSTYVLQNYFRGVPVQNPRRVFPHTNIVGQTQVIADTLIHGSVRIAPGDSTTNRDVIVLGDQICFGIVAASYDDEFATPNVSGSTGGISQAICFVAGPVQAPKDTLIGVDDDVIHLSCGPDIIDTLFADAGSVEPAATVLVFSDPAATDTTDPSFMGSVVANADGSWGPIVLTTDGNTPGNLQDPATGFIYLRARDISDNISPATAIYRDIDGTGIQGPDYAMNELPLDLTTPNQIYADGDSIVVTATFGDTIFAGTPVIEGVTTPAPNVTAFADFSQIVTVGGADAVPFINHGTDGFDQDLDWQDNDTDAAADPGDADFLSDDVGLDGVAGTADQGENDGNPTPGEYFCDVGGPNGAGAGDGAYTPGEAFEDVNGNNLRDPGEPDIDLNDSDEYGIYSARWTIAPGTSVTNDGQTNFAQVQNVPVVITAVDCVCNETLMDGTDPENRYLVEIDNQDPSVSELADLEQETDFGGNSATDNQLEEQNGASCFDMGEFIDFTIETPSDADVDYVVMQISVNGGPWQDMSFDPPGEAIADTIAGNYPGAALADDDRDGDADSLDAEVAAAIDEQVNNNPDGVDNDNDGWIDEETDGVDNDGDGVIDAPADGDEVETYSVDNDDNEDGIVDGVATDVGAPGVYDRAYNPQPHVLDAAGLGGVATTFDWFDHSSVADTKTNDVIAGTRLNLDLAHIRNVFGITDADSFQLRGVAVDNTGGAFYGPETDIDGVDVGVPGPTGDVLVSVILADQSGFSADGSPANSHSGNADPGYALPFCIQTNFAPSVTTLIDNLDDEICDAAQNEQGGDPVVPGDETAQIPATPEVYTLEAGATADAESVIFWVSLGDSADWAVIDVDRSGPPWTTNWVPGLVDNDPAARVNRYWLTTTSVDVNGNAESLDRNGDGGLDTLDFQVQVDVVDCVAPVLNITRVQNGVGVTDDDLTDGATVPINNAINIWIDAVSPGAGYTGFSDRDEIFMIGAGVNLLPGDNAFDDDADGTTDEFDFGPDGIMGSGFDGLDNDGDGVVDNAEETDDEWGFDDDVVYGYVARAGLGLDRNPGNRDNPPGIDGNEDADGLIDELDYGPDGVAGTADDEFLRTTDAGVPHDDFFTNDVIRVDFQYRPTSGGGPWLPIPGTASLTGTIVNGNVSDLVPPLKVTWDVTGLPPGDYDIRAQGFDIEGNTNDGTAFISTIKIDPTGLRAYITPPVQEPADPAGVFDLYAHTYIHDTFIDHVDFEFSTDDGASWAFIARDDNDDASNGGDVLMRAGTTPFQSATASDVVGGTGRAFGTTYRFLDRDADGYSALDPIIVSADAFLDGGDNVVLGQVEPSEAGAALTQLNSNGVFDAASDIYYVDTGGSSAFEPQDWIYQDNVNNAQTSGFDLWTVVWDARGLSGEVWVRAVATNELGVTDSDGIPYEVLDIDVDAPCAEISGIVLMDGTFEAPNYDTLDVFSTNDFIQIRATVAAADVEEVVFQMSVDGGANWFSSTSYFDVNDDSDFYADIDGIPGFSAGDEIFFDADGDFKRSAADVVLRNQGITDPITPLGWQLIPLLGEDGPGSGDEDDDGQTDEDDVDSTDLLASSGGYYDAFLNIVDANAAGLFQTDTQVLFRAIATDSNNNTCPNPTFFKAIIHERSTCLVDAIVATTQTGDTLDIFSELSDGDGSDQIDASVTTVNVFATAEDGSTITGLRLFYRKNPLAYPGLNVFTNPWIDSGVSDATYPYNLAWGVAGLADGCYQFYVQCSDASGNNSDAPAAPYEISKLTVSANITLFQNSLGETIANGASVYPGDEMTIFADLSNPAATADAEVLFQYAERIVGEVVTLSPGNPYRYDLALTAVLDGDPDDESTVDVTVNGVPATYYTEDAFDALGAKTINQFTMRNGGATVELGGAQSAGVEILISYNVTGYNTIPEGDRNAPFSVEWNFTTGGIPGASFAETNAFDIIASVSYDFFSTYYENEGGQTPPGDPCLIEPDLSEGRFVLLLDAEGPCATIHGFELDRGDTSYPYLENQPGNPLCFIGDKNENGLAAKEVDVFITTDEAITEIDSVYAFVDGEATQYDFTRYTTTDSDASNDSISIPITFYVQDYSYLLDGDQAFNNGIALDPNDIENVTLRYALGINFNEPAYELVMYDDGVNGGDKTANDGCYTATPRLALGSTYGYSFDVDLIGDNYEPDLFDDRRNFDGDAHNNVQSAIVVPGDFWYFHFDSAVPGIDVLDNGVHTIIAWAVDVDGNRRSSKSCDGEVGSFIVDNIAPIINMIDMTSIVNPNDEDCSPYTASVMIAPNPASIPALGVDEVQFQYSPDNGGRWIFLGNDTSSDGGWALQDDWTIDPMEDGIDNDGDGFTDETDLLGDGESEEQVTFLLRALAKDDCGNVGYSSEIAFVIDTRPPDCELIAPATGTLYAYGDIVTLSATSPDAGNLSKMTFQYMDRGGEWRDIDWTPQDDSDPNYVPAPFANADTVTVTWDSRILDLDGENPFVWFRCCAADSACNEDCENQPIIVQFYDASAPGAWITQYDTDCGQFSPADPKLSVQGDDIVVSGIAIDPSGYENVAKVTVERRVSEGVWAELATVFGVFGSTNDVTATWQATIDVTPYCGTTLVLRSLATDVNGNTSENLITYNLPVDCVEPVVAYNADGFIFIDSTAVYENDGTTGTGLVIKPNPFTGDVVFRVTTDDPDVQSMLVQYREVDPTEPGDWQTLEVCDSAPGATPVVNGSCDLTLDFEPNVTVPGGGYFWWGVARDWAEEISLDDGKYEFRVLATDYACNTNALSLELVAATIDTEDPFCTYFGNNAIGERPQGEVAAGDTVRLVLTASDAETDVEAVWYEWSFDQENWVTIGSDKEPEGDKIDTDNPSWASDILWTTPDYVVYDKDAYVRAHIFDSAWNEEICEQTIRIEDKTPPFGTRIYDIVLDDGGCIQPPDITPNTIMGGTTINSSVDIFAQTAVGDTGIAEVTFEISGDNGVTWTTIGIDQNETELEMPDGSGPGMLVWTWSIEFDPKQLNTNGNRAFPDGNYLIRASAVDSEENYEILTATAPMRAPLTIDCTPPVVKMNVVDTTEFDATPQVCETNVERGSIINVGGRTVVSETDMTETTNEDVEVTFYIANTKDELWVTDSWKAMTPANGFHFDPLNNEDNPDESRPYSFYWNTALTEPPLVVGNSYAIVAVGEDLVCNVGEITETWMAGLGTCFTILDTTAPCATIVELERDNDPSYQQWPDYSRVNRLDYLGASILPGDTDVEKVDFYYRAQGATAWILADGDLTRLGDTFWELSDWTSDNLTEGTYEFAANAVDDVGNADFDPSNAASIPCSITRLIIDRSAPVIAEVTAPADSQTCADARYIYDNDGDATIDVWVNLSAEYLASNGNDVYLDENGEDNDDSGVKFQWKYSQSPDVDDEWDSSGFDNILFDARSGRFSTTFDVDEPADDIVDFRVVMQDSAGNVSETVFATWVVLPTEDPDVAITQIKNLATDTTIDPNDQGQQTDISAGDPIQIWVTARTGSQYVPAWASCGLDSTFFEVARSDEKGEEPNDDDYMPLTVGTATQDTLPGGNAFFAEWNTTGLTPGFYWVRAFAVDCCGNRGDSEAVELRVKSQSLPKVAVVCFDEDVVNDITGHTIAHVYAQEWCDQEVDKVIFEYRDANGPGSTDWVVFGFTESVSDADSLWISSVDLTTTTSFAIGDQIDFRATAIKYIDDEADDDSRIIDMVDPTPVVTSVTVQRNPIGTRDLVLVPVRTNPELVSFESVNLVPEARVQWTVAVNTNAVTTVPWLNVISEDTYDDQDQWEESVKMYRSTNELTLWRGGATKAVTRQICDGGTINFCAAAVDSAIGRVDIAHWSNKAYRVNTQLGSNGPVSLEADADHSVSVEIPPGNSITAGAILLSRTIDPSTEEDEDQTLYLSLLPNSCWDLRQLDCANPFGFRDCSESIDETYPATVTIKYDEADFPLEYQASEWESKLVPAYYDTFDEQFHIDEIFTVKVDTLANTVTFKTEELCDKNVYCLIIPKVEPLAASIYPLWNGFSNDHPIIQGTLTDIFTTGEGNDGNDLDLNTFKLWIDNRLVAWTDDYQDQSEDGLQGCDPREFPGDEDFEENAVGNGCLDLDAAENDDDYTNTAVFTYHHSTLSQDELAPGEHTLRIAMYGQTEDASRWYDRKWVFNVDVTPPRAWINGGFVDSPILSNVGGYINSEEPALTAYLLDRESGVMVKPRQADPILNVLFSNLVGGEFDITVDFPTTPENPDVVLTIGSIELPIQDVGLKMDVWLVDEANRQNNDGEDDEEDIDEYFDRNLIQTATADMLEFTPPLPLSNGDDEGTYTPADTLIARFPLVVDLAQYDGRELEVVLYTAKLEHIGHDISNIDDILGGLLGSLGTGKAAVSKADPTAEVAGDEEFTKYLLGAMDCVGNVGSAYTAARFIVDGAAPSVAFVSPQCNASVAPGQPLNVIVALTDQTFRPDVDNDGDGLFAEDPADGIDNDGDWVGRAQATDGTWFYVDDKNQNGRADAGDTHVDEDGNDSETLSGSGIDTSSVRVTVVGPDLNQTFQANSTNFRDGQLRFTVTRPDESALSVGDYTISVRGRDRLGNGFDKVCSFSVANAVLAVFGGAVFPNPFDPGTGNATIQWEMSQPGFVTIEVYDFAGDFVGKIVDGQRLTPAEAAAGVPWGGTNEDGDELADGGYIAHIVVKGTGRTQTTDIKIAIDRQD
ncbi:MAG: hypothetical protein ACKVU1_07125 [bacterium]